MPVLGKVYGLLVSSGQISWRDLVSYAMLPYGEARFWTSASQHYRSFAVLFIAYALEVSHRPPSSIYCFHYLYHLHGMLCGRCIWQVLQSEGHRTFAYLS